MVDAVGAVNAVNAEFTVNALTRRVACDPRDLLLDVVRENLGLRGTKYGCGEGECGACTVLLNGRCVTACLTTAGQAQGAEITTIEALTGDETGRRLLDGFIGSGAVQCGFCTPGFVLAARSLLAEKPHPSRDEIRTALEGNLCRCTGYASIVEAVTRAAPGKAVPGPASGHPVGGIIAEDYARPATLDEALRALAEPQSAWRVLAGGTDVLVRYEHHVKDLRLLDIGGLAELRGVRETSAAVHIGALTCFADIARSPIVQRWAPALVTAARGVGGAQIQNMATVGGNVVNASPAADAVPALFVMDARLILRSARGDRTVPIAAFVTGPGRTVLAPDELLTEIVLPKRSLPGTWITVFDKVGPRRAMTIAKASISVSGWLRAGRWRDVRIALGAVSPTVIAAPKAAELLMSDPFNERLLLAAADEAAGECTPIDDVRSTAWYRRRLVSGLLVRNLLPYVSM